MKEQMALFDWSPPKKVFVFPLSRRVGKIRRVADVLSRKQGRDAEVYWKTTVRQLVDNFARFGVDEESAASEIREFHDAVQRELSDGAPYTDRRPGGDAA